MQSADMCQRCTIRRNTCAVLHHDKATNKDWTIIKCGTCGYNIDLYESPILPATTSKWLI
jgi:hypothetical protein